MKKKGYYIHLKLRENQVGVRQKIDGQIAVLRQYFDVLEIGKDQYTAGGSEQAAIWFLCYGL